VSGDRSNGSTEIRRWYVIAITLSNVRSDTSRHCTGVANGAAVGTAGVVPMAEKVLQVVAVGGASPILVPVDTPGQLMRAAGRHLYLSYRRLSCNVVLLASSLPSICA
jgi:hypothetical protein